MTHHSSRLNDRFRLERALWTSSDAESPSSEEESLFGLRLKLIARVRDEIAAGSYETPEKWEKALERLFEAVS